MTIHFKNSLSPFEQIFFRKFHNHFKLNHHACKLRNISSCLNISLQARIQKKLDEELPQERIGGMKLGPKVSGNQGLSKS